MAATGGSLDGYVKTTVSRGISLDCFMATVFIGPGIGPKDSSKDA